MKLSKKSKLLMKFINDTKYVDSIEANKKTESILSELYNDILKAYQHLLYVKNTNESFYNIQIKNIQTASQITKPKQFNSNSFPLDIRTHIDNMSFSELSYTFSLFNKNIKLIFILEEVNIENKIKTYNKYVDSIIMWVYILNEYASKLCAKSLTTYFYFTSLEKKTPESDISILDEIHINTAFTRTCQEDAEIVIYRKEEWFKVFMHETFHTFGLDFSDMNTNSCTNKILNIFPVNSEVNLYESYAEFWAEIMNALFCSFLHLKKKDDIETFIKNADLFIHHERSHSFLQLVKIIHFMGLKYKDLYKKNSSSQILRETLYKEKTNVLSYYIIKTILMNNYQGFLYWCKTNNNTLLQFRKSPINIDNYCKFIEKNYKTTSMLENIERTEKLFEFIKSKNIKNVKNVNNLEIEKNIYKFINTNLRMSVCEMG